MPEIICSTCKDLYPSEDIADGKCVFCRDKEKFAVFAKSCGLDAFPDPSGERYLYNLDGSVRCKKSEHSGFMDELWNALVHANKDLLMG